MNEDEEAVALLNELDAHLQVMFPGFDAAQVRVLANEALSFIDEKLGHALLNLVHDRPRDHGEIEF